METDGVRHWIHDYHPYRRGYNTEFQAIDRLILDLKDGKEFGIAWAVEELKRELRIFRTHGPLLVVVPPHDPARHTEQGIRQAAKRLVVARAWNGLAPGIDCLHRTRSVAKKAMGGSRDLAGELETVGVVNERILLGRYVLLLDDVTTSGTTLKAGTQILGDAGAREVVEIAIGRTV